jgi:DNA-binding NtrC family response regulator
MAMENKKIQRWNEEDPDNSQGRVSLSGRVEALRELARALLLEVEALGESCALDLGSGIKIHDELRRFEIDLIWQALKLTGGHQKKAARLLGLNATTLNAKLKRYKIRWKSPAAETRISPDQGLELRN